jgi:methyltransferase
VELGGTGQGWYLGLVGAVACERVVELLVARRNLRSVAKRGGFVADSRTHGLMVTIQIAWMLAAPIEVVSLGRPFLPRLGVPMLLLLALTMALRYWVVATLGDRWNLRTVVVPGEPPVTGGPYRLVRHPNYVAVALETVALPLVHTAWITAGVALLVHLPVLARRMTIEEAALARHCDYARVFAGRGRVLP